MTTGQVMVTSVPLTLEVNVILSALGEVSCVPDTPAEKDSSPSTPMAHEASKRVPIARVNTCIRFVNANR